METFSALLALRAGNSPVTGEFPAQSPVMRSFDVFFDLHPNKWLSKQFRRWWFETPSRPLWRFCNVIKSHYNTVNFLNSHKKHLVHMKCALLHAVSWVRLVMIILSKWHFHFNELSQPSRHDIWSSNNVIIISKRRRDLTSGANEQNGWHFACYFEAHFLSRNFLYSLKCISRDSTDTWFRKWFGANQVTGPYFNQFWPRSTLLCDILQ